MSIDRPSLRLRIGATFVGDSDLDAFCVDHFPEVAARFTHGMDRVQKVTLLLQHADAERIDRLLRGHETPTGSASPWGMARLAIVSVAVLAVAIVSLVRALREAPASSTMTSATAPSAPAAILPASAPASAASPPVVPASLPAASRPAATAGAPPAAPAGPTSGTASCQGTKCSIALGGGVLPDSVPRVCLVAPESSADLDGVQPVCTLYNKGGTTCFRSDRAAPVALKAPITWKLCP